LAGHRGGPDLAKAMNRLHTSRAREHGFALLVVLWTLPLLALLGAQLVSASRREAMLARNLIDAASLRAATDGGVQEAIFHLLDRSHQRWAADGVPRTVQVGAAEVTIRIENEGDKINPNIAAESLLTALLLRVNAAPTEAGAIAAAILDWRTATSQARPRGAKAPQYTAAGLDYGPPGSEFRSVDELGAVLGMRPALLALLRPHVTVFSDSDPDGSTRDPVVLAALIDTQAGPPDSPADGQVVSIVAGAQGRNQASYAERAVVRLNAPAGQRLFEMLTLERLDSTKAGAAR
jgi:general secretion pathway protein K